MISQNLKDRLAVIKESGKVPNVLLVTGLYDQDVKSEQLIEVVKNIESSEVSEAKGNIIFLDSESLSTIKVDDVRDLLKRISLRNWDSGSGRYVLVPRSELLTVQSSNALLKSLEEAPDGTYFVLGAPSKRSVLRTILSRSFVLNEELGDLNTKESANIFEEAIFNSNLEPFLKVVRADLKAEWQDFSLKAKDKFVSEVYSGELNKAEWHRLFDFMDDLDEKIEANMDTKWLASSIERFGFNG